MSEDTKPYEGYQVTQMKHKRSNWPQFIQLVSHANELWALDAHGYVWLHLDNVWYKQETCRYVQNND